MQKWKSIHVFYHDINHKEIILCNVVAPFLKVLKEKGALEKWFFINYWEGGPHLRIRMLNMEEAQYDFLLEKMKEYIVKHPSSFSITREQYYHNNRFDGEKVNVTELPWYEDGSIIEIPYVPEIERYGGENAIAKAESMFCYSSQLAASLIQATVGDFNKRFSVAIDLFIEALFCSGCLTKQYLLLEMGIRQFTLIDNQEVGSMDKRWAYFCKKSDQAAVRNQWVAKVAKEEYSDASFTLYENLEEYLACQKDEQECKSYCIVCKDEIEKEELLLYNDLFIKYDMKWTSVYIDSEKVSIGPTIIPRVTGCLECTTHSYEWPIYNGFNMVQLDSFHLAASLLAEDIYCHLGNIHEYIIKDISFTLGKQFVINLSGFNGHSNELIIDPRCNCRDKK